MGTFLKFLLESSLPTDKDFAIVTAYTKSSSKEELMINAGKLSADLDSFVLVHQVLMNGKHGEVVYFVEKPESMDKDEMRTIIRRVSRDYGTNKYILKRDDTIMLMDANSPDPVKTETKSYPSKESLEKLYKEFFYGKDEDVIGEEPSDEEKASEDEDVLDSTESNPKGEEPKKKDVSKKIGDYLDKDKEDQGDKW
jgi:hypothetical protein